MSRNEINNLENENWVKISEDEFQKQKEESFEKHLLSKRGNGISNKNTRNYLSEPNVREFNKEMRKKVFNSCGVGRSYAFESIEKLEEDTEKFFELCDRTATIPTVVNLAVWLGCHKDTIYAHANNPNSPFSDFFKNLLSFFHGTMESSAIGGGVNPVLYMFLSKNYFGMRDDKNITVTPTTGDNTINNQATMSALQKQLEEENVPNATFTEND